MAAEGPAPAAEKVPLTFEDVAVYFSADEWLLLEEHQKVLYRDLMKENFESLSSLGLVNVKPEIISQLELWERTSVWDEAVTKYTEMMDRELSSSDGVLFGKGVTEKVEEMEMSCSKKQEDSMVQVKSEDVEMPISKSPRDIKTQVKKRKEVEPTSRCLRSSMTNVKIEQEDEALLQLKNKELGKVPTVHLGGSTVHLKIECEEQPLSTNCQDTPLQIKQEETDEATGAQEAAGLISEGYRSIDKFKARSSGRIAKNIEPYNTRSRKADQKMLNPESTTEKQKPLLRKQTKLPENILPVNTQCTKGVCKATSSSGLLNFNSEEKQDAGGGILSTSELPCVQQSKTYCIRSKREKSFSGHAQLLAHQAVPPRKISGLYVHEGMRAEGQLCEGGEIEQHSPHVTPQSAQSEAEQYTCTECGKQFDQSSDLAIHQQVHTEERPYGFNELEEGISSTGELTIPFQNSTKDKTYVCEKCGKGFGKEFNLKKHQRLHRRTRLCECNECGKKFCSLSGLQAHHQMHNAGYRSSAKYKVRSSTRIAKNIEPYNTRSTKADQKMLKPESTMEKQRKLSENILHALGVNTQRMKGVCKTTSPSGSPSINSEERPDAGGGVLSTSEIPCKQQSETDGIRSRCDKSSSGHAQLLAHQEVNPRKTSDLYTLEGMDAERQLCVDGEIEQHSPHAQSAQSVADQYTCTDCGKQFDQSSDLASHQQVHLVERPYGFNELEEDVSSTGELTIAFQNSTEAKTYDCNKCGKQFCFLSGAQAHHQIYNTGQMYTCAACEKCFDAAQLLTTHQAILSKEENLTNLVMPTPEETLYLCADCGESFNGWELLVAHSATHTSQKEDSGKETDLEINHMEMAHTCTECGMNFNDPFTLSRHQQQHKQDKELVCNYCGKCFDNLLLVMAHKQKHLKNRQYVCTECGYVLRTSSSLRAHHQMHIMEKLYTCIECGKGFRNAHLLSTHQLTHVGENPYLCGDCGECFPDPASFISHHKSHTTRTPYSCKECGKRFTTKSGLDFHLLTHTKEENLSNLNTPTVNGEPCMDLTDEHRCAEAENPKKPVKTLFIIKKETYMNSTNREIHLKEENQTKVNSIFIKKEPCLVSDQPHSHIKEENQTNLNTLIEKKEFVSDSVNQHSQAKEGKQKTVNTLINNEEPYLDLAPKNGIINWASLSVLQQTRVAQETFPCDKCTAIFTCSADLSMHQTEHSQEPEFVCFECGQCMSSSYQLSKHRQMHKQEKLHECTECGMSFSTSALLSRHQQTHEVGRLYTCTECGQAFRTASYLYRHKQKHLRDNILEEFYECPTCKQGFRNSRLLETHQLTHAGENPYLCSDCGESFKDPASFITHHKTHTQVNKRHTQVKPYVCSECGRKYRTNTLLTVHQLIHLPGY